MKQKRTFKKSEKLAILKEASEQGVKITIEKHGIYPATYYSWRKKFKEMGEIGLAHGMNQDHLNRIRELEKENQQLKELVAEKELVVRMHEELNHYGLKVHRFRQYIRMKFLFKYNVVIIQV